MLFPLIVEVQKTETWPVPPKQNYLPLTYCKAGCTLITMGYTHAHLAGPRTTGHRSCVEGYHRASEEWYGEKQRGTVLDFEGSEVNALASIHMIYNLFRPIVLSHRIMYICQSSFDMQAPR